jgi:hypothetical protein
MAEFIYNQLPSLKAKISFLPLLELWKSLIQNNSSAAANICSDLYFKFNSIPELLVPTDDYSVLEKHKVLVDEAMTTIFPAAFTNSKDLHAVAMPFSSKVIYASNFFKKTYLDDQGNYLHPLDPIVAENIAIAKINLAYKLIFKQWYNIELIGVDAFISSYPEHQRNIHNYFELEWDPQFISVTASFEPPPLPDHLMQIHHVRNLVKYPEVASLLPLDHFLFEGLIITRIREVSERETINNIRTILERNDCFEDKNLLNELKQQIRYLIQLPDAEIGFIAFYNTDPEVESQTLNYGSLLLQKENEKNEILSFCQCLKEKLIEQPDYFWSRKNINFQNPANNRLEKQLVKDGWQHALISALYHDQKEVGALEILTSSNKPIELKVLVRLQHAKEILQRAILQFQQLVESKINHLVKEHFTAIQPSVEWKFKNAAIKHLLQLHNGNNPEMSSVVFEDVFPLFGAIDIKNSSGERNNAVQNDLLKQLNLVKEILEQILSHSSSSSVQKKMINIQQFIDALSKDILKVDEQAVQDFLNTEVKDILIINKEKIPGLHKKIDDYLNKEPKNTHRSKFEESVTKLNNLITSHLDQEQEQIQNVYPFYFERFVTDGVDFNLYIGQSITPGTPIQQFHLKNIKIWLLSFLATMAQKLNKLSPDLPVPLQTTQLLFVYKEPISIRFRNAERKFDIDGVRHSQYEIIKKRLDKATIKGSYERLTQPGKIAIVYSDNEDAKEYLQYIKELEKLNILTGSVDYLEVEDLQSVSGLKALRVSVQFNETNQYTEKQHNHILHQ